MEPFFFDPDRLRGLADRHRDAYAAGQPFPHTIIDDFVPAWVIDGLLAEFPDPDGELWGRYRNARERKLAAADPTLMGPFTRQFLAECNSATFVDFIGHLTGIGGLVPDPWYEGGGLHQITRGGFLKVHADFNQHDRLRLDRRVNAILYLNREWDPAWGGDLELWDRDMQGCVERVRPIANRLLVFNTVSDGYHGHPDPLACPEDRQRRSRALYYYSRGRPEEEAHPAHTTLFQRRPGEGRERDSLKESAKRWLPPAAVDAWRHGKARRQQRRVR